MAQRVINPRAADLSLALQQAPGKPFASPSGGQEADSPIADEREHLTMLIRYFEESEDLSARARELSERDRDYHDNFDDNQWTPAQKATMRRRGQPLITSNYVKRKVATLCGVEQRMRSDPKAFPRTPQIDENSANAATDALRFIGDSNQFNTLRSKAYEEMLVEGYCGADVVARPRRDGSYDVKIKRVAWDRLFYDPHSTEEDFSDAEYKGIVIWQTARRDDDGPLGETLRQSGSDTYGDRPRTAWVDSKRTRVRVVQIHYLYEGQWWVAKFTRAGFIDPPQLSPYLDDEGEPACSLIMQACYVDRENNRFGAVRDWISTQEEINKRRSKAVHQINSRQTFGNKVAVVDVDEAKAQMAMPDGHLAIGAGAKFGEDWGIIPTTDQSSGNFQLLQQAIAEMQASGPNAAMAGKAKGAQSGRALEAQVQAGAVEIEPQNDKLRTFTRNVYAAAWMRARQFWTAETWVRVTDDDRNVRFVGLNRNVTLEERLARMPEEMRAQAMQQMQIRPGDPRLQQIVEVENRTAGLHVDIEIEEGPDISSLQGEQFDTVASLAKAGLPLANGKPMPLEALVELSTLRNKDQWLQKWGGQGQQDPAIAQMQQQMQQMGGMIAQLQQALKDKNAELTIKAHDSATKLYAAETDREIALQPAMSPQQVQALVVQALQDLLRGDAPGPAPAPAASALPGPGGPPQGPPQ
jgi:hypothetical protein